MYTISKNNQEIHLSGVEPESSSKEPLFVQWLEGVDPSWIIESVEFQSIDRAGASGRILFIKMKAAVRHPDGFMPGMVVVLRDCAVSALCVLTCEGQKYAFLVDQPRVPAGRTISESVAGLIDDGMSPASVILRELEEEASLVTRLGITDKDVVPLQSVPFYATPGMTNEAVYPFLVEKEISRDLLESYQGLKQGLEEEYEHITVRIVPFDKVIEYCHCATTLAMLYLYQQYLLTK